MKTVKLFFISGLTYLFIGCAEKAPPTITLKGEENVEILLGDQFSDPGIIATDYRGKDISDRLQILGSVDANAGFYTLDYLVTDKKGQTTVATRNVTRGFRNTDIEGAYDVTHSANNGGGTYNFVGFITADSEDEVSFTIDQSNCVIAPVVLTAIMNNGALQFDIPDQTSNGNSITNGQFNNINGGTSENASLSMSFQSFNGSLTYNHTATWTKQ